MPLPLPKVTLVDYGPDETAMVRYRAEGHERAMALGNRGPIRFDEQGNLHPDIAEAYWRCGFYVLEEVLKPEELDDIEQDVADLLERAPTERGSKLDRHGRPALGTDCKARNVFLVKPLSDAYGGTDFANGRHPAKMAEPTPPPDAPAYVPQVVLGSLQFSDACLRLYGHPQLLQVAAAINGLDFTPFNESVWVKHPGLGGSVAWHQDGWTHWDSPKLDAGTHGFNFMAQLYGCTPANGLWVVPGSHAMGKVDIKAMVADAGSDRLPDAVPLVCGPGDVAMCSRQAIHGSFANTSADVRVSINFGFHRRASVLGVTSGGVHNEMAVYDDERIRRRSRLIAYAIDARQQRFPDEQPYSYQPLVAEAGQWRWTPSTKAEIKDYNLLDLGI